MTDAVVGKRRLWLGVLLAPGMWVLSELVGYYVAARSCEHGVTGVPLAGATHVLAAHTAIVVIAAIIAAIGLIIAAGNWRATRESVGADRSAAVGRAYFMSFVGVVGSALFLWGIIMFGISAFALNACSQAR
jgi:hypothetical protein